MPSFVIKAERDRDLYVLWSTIVDAPTAWGTRAEMVRVLVEDGDNSANAEARLARADEAGTSARWPSPANPFGGWQDDGFILMEWDERPEVPEDGYVNLPRNRLAAFIDAVEAGQSVLSIVEVRDQYDNLVAAPV